MKLFFLLYLLLGKNWLWNKAYTEETVRLPIIFKALQQENGKKLNAYNMAWHRNKERSCYKL